MYKSVFILFVSLISLALAAPINSGEIIKARANHERSLDLVNSLIRRHLDGASDSSPDGNQSVNGGVASDSSGGQNGTGLPLCPQGQDSSGPCNNDDNGTENVGKFVPTTVPAFSPKETGSARTLDPLDLLRRRSKHSSHRKPTSSNVKDSKKDVTGGNGSDGSCDQNGQDTSGPCKGGNDSQNVATTVPAFATQTINPVDLLRRHPKDTSHSNSKVKDRQKDVTGQNETDGGGNAGSCDQNGQDTSGPCTNSGENSVQGVESSTQTTAAAFSPSQSSESPAATDDPLTAGHTGNTATDNPLTAGHTANTAEDNPLTARH